MSTSAPPARPLRVLVVGPGVGDGRRRSWAYVTRPLTRLGHQVYVADSAGAESADVVAASFDWNVHTNRPDVVVQLADGVAAHHDGVAALSASGAATTIGVRFPFALDPMNVGAPARPLDGPHHVLVDVGCTDPLLTDPGTFLAPDRPPLADVACLGARSPGAEEVALGLADAGLSFRLLDASWDTHPLLRGLAYGRPPFRFLGRRLATGRVVLVLPSASPEETELRRLEATCSGRRVVVLADGTDGATAAALAGAALDDEPDTPPATGWSDAWPTILERALATHRPDQPERRFWSFNVAPAPRPKVAVITSVYRGADYLHDAVDSLLEQTMPDVEVMLLDDGSDDETTGMIEALSHEDRRVRGFRQDNIGQRGRFDLLAHQLLAESRAPFLAHLGADDLAHPERFARQLAVLDDRPDVHVVCSNVVQIDGEGRVTGEIVQIDDIDKWSMARWQMLANHVSHPTVMMRREVFDLAGPYSRAFAADYDFWTKSAGWLGYHRITDRLVAYRVHERGSSTVGEAAQRATREFEWIRGVARRELTLLDLYPELDHLDATPATIARTAAHFAAFLLAMPLRSTGVLAAEEIDLARHVLTDPAIDFNALYASLAVGNPPVDIVDQLRRLAAQGIAEAQPVLERIDGHRDATIGPVPANVVFPAIAAVHPGPDDRMWYMAGRNRVHTAWVAVDWHDPVTLTRLLDEWCRHFPVGSAVRLVLAQDGIDPLDAITALQKAAADASLDIAAAADIELSADQRVRASADVDLDLRTATGRERIARGLATLRRRVVFS